jgi:hypothetical protein
LRVNTNSLYCRASSSFPLSPRSSVLVSLVLLAGCASAPPPPEPPVPDPASGKAAYWLDKPAAAVVYDQDYDELWGICADLARSEQFTLDRQDYRDGILTTHPLVSRQIFEFWRPDSGDLYYVVQNSLQTVRRTIEFQFHEVGEGYTVTPKVVIERLAQQNKRITSTSEYGQAFGGYDLTPDITNSDLWFAVGRDLMMEAELANAIKQHIAPG